MPQRCVSNGFHPVCREAVACAKERYERLIKSAGRAMVGESKLAMEDLVGDLDRP
jgi:hypothetical protein